MNEPQINAVIPKRTTPYLNRFDDLAMRDGDKEIEVTGTAEITDLLNFYSGIQIPKGDYKEQKDFLSEAVNQLTALPNAPELLSRMLLAVDTDFYFRLANKAKTDLGYEHYNTLGGPRDPACFNRSFSMMNSARRAVESDIKLCAAIEQLKEREQVSVPPIQAAKPAIPLREVAQIA